MFPLLAPLFPLWFPMRIHYDVTISECPHAATYPEWTYPQSIACPWVHWHIDASMPVPNKSTFTPHPIRPSYCPCPAIPTSRIHPVVLGKFGPGLIETWSGLDQTPQSQSWSGIFPKKPDCLVSGLGIPILPGTIQTQSGLGLLNCYLHW